MAQRAKAWQAGGVRRTRYSGVKVACGSFASGRGFQGRPYRPHLYRNQYCIINANIPTLLKSKWLYSNNNLRLEFPIFFSKYLLHIFQGMWYVCVMWSILIVNNKFLSLEIIRNASKIYFTYTSLILYWCKNRHSNT